MNKSPEWQRVVMIAAMISALMTMMTLPFAASADQSGGQASEPLPPVYLNHFFLVIDSETYAAIERQPFLRKEFAPNEARTTARADITYTGLYFYGVNTYFEFFDLARETRRSLGDSGIAYGVEQEGAVKSLQARLKSAPPRLVTRPFQDRQVNWFYSLTPPGFSFTSGMSSWLMEYHPAFLAAWNPQAGESNRGISRRQALKRYAEVLPERPPNPVFEDVLAISLAVDKATMESMAAMCRAFGYTSQTAGEAQVLAGPQFTLRLLPESATARGIQEITLRLQRLPQEKELRFGKRSVLKFHADKADKTATWSF